MSYLFDRNRRKKKSLISGVFVLITEIIILYIFLSRYIERRYIFIILLSLFGIGIILFLIWYFLFKGDTHRNYIIESLNSTIWNLTITIIIWALTGYLIKGDISLYITNLSNLGIHIAGLSISAGIGGIIILFVNNIF